MTASMVSSEIPWFSTKQAEYRVVRAERWYDILGGYRTIEETDVRTGAFDVLGQCSSSGHIKGSDVDKVTVRDRFSVGVGQPGLARNRRIHITGIFENASEAII